jgi:spermidine synthase
LKLKAHLSVFTILLILVFVAGLATMSLEFSVSRLLIPVFGSSIYTWGSLIGVVLVGLSSGYHLGGKLADKNPTFEKFCSILFSAGLYVLFIPFISSFTIDLTTSIINAIPDESENNYSNNLHPLFTTLLLIIIPTVLLGMISPYAIKLSAKTLDKLGNISGNLYSVSTIGSIAGTFITVFILIPLFEIDQILYSLGILLIVSSLIGLKLIPKILGLFILIGFSFSLILDDMNVVSLNFQNFHLHPGQLIYETETLYSHLDVIDNYDSINNRALFLNGYPHSIMDKADPYSLESDYTKFFPLGLLLNDNTTRVLFIGGGGFSGPKYFTQYYPNVSVDVVEIDPQVVEVAKKYFFLDTSNSKIKIYTGDAREFLADYGGKYDIIVLDAFSKDYVPFHLMTIEFYSLLFDKLTDNGVIISNHIGSSNDKQSTSDLYRANLKTFLEVFPNVYVFLTDYSKTIQNIILAPVKTENPDERNISDKLEIAEMQKLNTKVIEEVNYKDYVLETAQIPLDDVPILTDQHAPVENLLNPLSSKTYSIEEQANNKISSFEESRYPLAIAFSFPIVIATITTAVWLLLLKRIWRKDLMKDQK